MDTSRSSTTSQFTSKNRDIYALFRVYKTESPVSFASWMLYALPQVVILLAVCWLWLQCLFIGFRKFDRSHEGLVIRMLKKKYELLGPITYEEKSILWTFVVLIVLWLTRQPVIKFISITANLL